MKLVRKKTADYFLKIPKGNYSSPQHLVEETQRIIDIRFGEALRRSNASIEMTYGNNSKRVKFLQRSYVVKLIFSKLLAEKIGLNSKLIEKPIGNERHAFKYEVDLNTANNQLYVYSNIASYTYVGDITAPILRVVLRFRDVLIILIKSLSTCITFQWQNLS